MDWRLSIAPFPCWAPKLLHLLQIVGAHGFQNMSYILGGFNSPPKKKIIFILTPQNLCENLENESKQESHFLTWKSTLLTYSLVGPVDAIAAAENYWILYSLSTCCLCNPRPLFFVWNLIVWARCSLCCSKWSWLAHTHLQHIKQHDQTKHRAPIRLKGLQALGTISWHWFSSQVMP